MRKFFGIVFILLAFVFVCAGCADDTPVVPLTPRDSVDNGNPGSAYPFDPLVPSGISSGMREQAEPPSEYHWYPDIFEPYKTVVTEFYLTSTNGNQIFVDVHRPVWASAEKPCHGLVLVPGSVQKGEVWHVPWRRSGSYHWSAAGFIVMDFDFEGRGKSEGVEDYGGPVHREDLKTVIEYLANRPDVLYGEVGIVSSSYGATVTACTLGSYPDLPVRFWIDLEGAHNRYSATQNDEWYWVNLFGGHPMSDDEFWSEREAITWQPYITAPYIRVQADVDHAFDTFYVDHAFALVNAAVTGSSPYARMNHNTANVVLDVLSGQDYQYEHLEMLDEAMYMEVVEAAVAEF